MVPSQSFLRVLVIRLGILLGILGLGILLAAWPEPPPGPPARRPASLRLDVQHLGEQPGTAGALDLHPWDAPRPLRPLEED